MRLLPAWKKEQRETKRRFPLLFKSDAWRGIGSPALKPSRICRWDIPELRTARAAHLSIFKRFRRSAFVTTEMEDRLIAAAASMGLSSGPPNR